MLIRVLFEAAAELPVDRFLQKRKRKRKTEENVECGHQDASSKAVTYTSRLAYLHTSVFYYFNFLNDFVHMINKGPKGAERVIERKKERKRRDLQ